MRRLRTYTIPLALILAVGLPIRHGGAVPANPIPLTVVNGTERTQGTLDGLNPVR